MVSNDAMMTTVSPKEAALKSLGLGLDQADMLFKAAMKRDHLREQMSAADIEYRNLLPVATKEQMDRLAAHALAETSPEEGLRVNVDFRLDEAQQGRLILVRQERAAYCTANKDKIMIPLQEDDEQKLVSFKVRVGAKATVTTLKFVKGGATQAAKKGLIAAIGSVLQS